jgi:hypothetical protein
MVLSNEFLTYLLMEMRLAVVTTISLLAGAAVCGGRLLVARFTRWDGQRHCDATATGSECCNLRNVSEQLCRGDRAVCFTIPVLCGVGVCGIYVYANLR